MLSISPPISGFGQGKYYLTLSREDYYLAGGEPPGKWLGAGTKSLNLTGQVERRELEKLMMGYSPDGTKTLVQNAGDPKRRSGWDLTFSAPKSVSVAWSQSEGRVRAEFQNAHHEAVKTAIEYLNNHAAITRRGKGGFIKERVNLIVAAFEHGTSRAQDPQLHTHALVLNVAKRTDGTWGTIETKQLFQNKMAAGAIYRAELSRQLERRLGLVSKRVKSWFELKGVSKELISEFSKRRKQIEKALRDKGYSGAIAAKIATLDTRGAKGHLAREKLFSAWREVGRELGWSTKELTGLIRSKRFRRDRNFEIKRSIDSAIEKATAHSSHFAFRDIIRYAAEAAQGRGLGGKEIVTAVKDYLSHSQEIIRLGRFRGEIRYTTQEMLNLEKDMLNRARVLFDRDGDVVGERAFNFVLKKHKTISQEQRKAIEHITMSRGGIKVVSGMAGTGKSFMLGASRQVWERAGFKVYGAALAGKAAQGLFEDSGIESHTLHKTFSDIESGKLTFNSRSVLVVDEAGMVGTRLMAKVIATAQKTRAKLILVGDAKQLQPVDAGGPLKAIAERIGEVALKDIRRQREGWARNAVHRFAEGKAKEGLYAFAKRGLLSVSDSRFEAIDALIQEWEKNGALKPKSHIILTGTNIDAFELNERAQEVRAKKGSIGKVSVRVNSQDIFEKDRILFTRNSVAYRVKNGSLGTVVRINPAKKEILTELDNGKRIKVSLRNYQHIKLGYAITTHKSQGMTSKYSYVLVGGPMQDREFSYVQVSRAKRTTRLFTDKVQAGDKLTELARQMSSSRQKDLALSLKEPPKRFRRQRSRVRMR